MRRHCFVGILAIAIVIAMPRFGEVQRRYLFYDVLAILCAYFYLMTGAVPFLFRLSFISC
jgi:hypothetical protein